MERGISARLSLIGSPRARCGLAVYRPTWLGTILQWEARKRQRDCDRRSSFGYRLGGASQTDQRAGTQERNLYLFSTIGIVLYSVADAYVDAHLSRVDWAEVEAGIDENGAAKFRVKFKF